MNGTIFKTNNDKQVEFMDSVSTLGSEGFRYFFYGGAIRGGKTFVVLYILHHLSLAYPGSVWVVVREHLPALKQTTIPSFLKLLGDKATVHGKMNYSSHEYQYANGSKIIFKAENLKADKNLDSFLGLECNGFFLEQIEEQSEKMFEMAKQRAGSLYIPDMPKAYIFSTFNPTNRWVKKVIYDKWKVNELDKPYYYLNASPKDNPHVTQDQWSAWETLDSRTYAQMIEGDWAITEINDNRFIYAFDKDKHVSKEPLTDDMSAFIYLSFDFNVSPQTCIAGQINNRRDKVRIIKEYRKTNSGVEDVCLAIKNDFPDRRFIIAGDATGWNRDKKVGKYNCHYDIIMDNLKVGKSAIKVKKGGRNPLHTYSRTITNSLMDKHPDYLIGDCPYLIEDIKTTEANDKGGIKKEVGMSGHLTDCILYFNYHFLRTYLKFK